MATPFSGIARAEASRLGLPLRLPNYPNSTKKPSPLMIRIGT